MRQCPTYPKDALEKHIAAHRVFVDALTNFELKFTQRNLGALCHLVSGEFLDFLVDWLGTHIKNTDMKLGQYFNFTANKIETMQKELKTVGVDLGTLSSCLFAYIEKGKVEKFDSLSFDEFEKLLVDACAGIIYNVI